MNSEILKKRTKDFAPRCIRLAAMLPKTDLGNHVRRQVIRCATSVAANYRAVCLSQSRADFVSKLSTVIEEVDESEFWLDLVVEEKLVRENLLDSLVSEARELSATFIAARKTARDRTQKFVTQTGKALKVAGDSSIINNQ